jgi:signal transduction histidine kinase
MKAITAGLGRMDSAWADAWGQERMLRLATDAPWPEMRAMHLRSQHQTVPFVLFVNLAFAILTAGIFTDAAGWAFMGAWISAQVVWTLYVWAAWLPRQRRSYLLASPWALTRVLLGAAVVSVLWSIAIWVWFSHADPDGRHFMVAIVVGNLCVGTLAMSSIATGVLAYVLPQVLATAVSLVVYPRSYVELELVALVLLAMVLCWFGFYISRVLTANHLSKRRLEVNLRELQLARDQLVNSEKMASLGSLVAGVSHEVNTPLGVAVTACSAVADTLHDMLREYQERVLSQTSFEQTLVHAIDGVDILQNNLNRAARLIASFKYTVVSQVEDRLSDFDVMEVVRTLLVSLQPVMRRVPVTPTLTGPGRLNIRSYPSALMQVLTNLMMNSAMHAFEGVKRPEIDIEITDEQAVWTVTYRDNGVGVAPALHQRIFEPFFTTRRGRGGTGLGLNIVYTLVTQRLGGRLEFWSESAAGLRFRLELPSQAPPSPAPEENVTSLEREP